MKKSQSKHSPLNRGVVAEGPRQAPPDHPIKLDTGLLLNLKNKPGRCRACGSAFMGPGNQKYCQEHSPSVRYRGKY